LTKAANPWTSIARGVCFSFQDDDNLEDDDAHNDHDVGALGTLFANSTALVAATNIFVGDQ
jgi:hypothetical protein